MVPHAHDFTRMRRPKRFAVRPIVIPGGVVPAARTKETDNGGSSNTVRSFALGSSSINPTAMGGGTAHGDRTPTG